MLDSKPSQDEEVLRTHDIAQSILASVGQDRGGREVTSHNFSAMGTQFEFMGVGSDVDTLVELAKYAQHLEMLWTRFHNDSELMRANNSFGKPVDVSAETLILFNEMKSGFQLTHGLFNPGVLDDLVKNGFDTSAVSKEFKTQWNGAVLPHVTVRDIFIDNENCAITIPQGLAVDPGGIGKGLAADLLADRAMSQGMDGICVFAGGEVAVRGDAPTSQGWTVGVENPHVEQDYLDIVALHNGGLATSSTLARTSSQGHHLIDPRTHRSAVTDLLQATVVCARAVDAEVLTKMCFMLPIDLAIKEIERIGADALLIDDKLNRYETAGWENFV
ncbi:MAG: FAD:protein FMN transferase [Actinomycetes bacterium]